MTADLGATPGSLLLLQEADAGGPISQGPCAAAASSSAVVATVLVDPRGHPTTHRFNAVGVVIASTDALGQPTTYARDPARHLLIATTDALGRQTTYTYDALGNVLTMTRLAGTAEAVTTTVTYARPTGRLSLWAWVYWCRRMVGWRERRVLAWQWHCGRRRVCFSSRKRELQLLFQGTRKHRLVMVED